MLFPVPNVVKQVALGGLLGDSHIRQKEYNGKKCNAHMMITHCKEQKEYLEWKNLLLGPYGGNVRLTGRGQYTVTTKSHPHMNTFMEFVGKPKKVTRRWLNQLDELGLAIWYMDDGGLSIEYHRRLDGTYGIKRRRLTLATDCFSLEEHYLIQRYFNVVWDIEISFHKVKKKDGSKDCYRTTMNYTNAQKFVELVEPYIHPCMKYKIDFNRQRVCHNALPGSDAGDDIV